MFVSERCSGQKVVDADKYNLIVNHPTPSPLAVFPSRNGRRFQFSWLAIFKWLRFSKHDNGGYCLSCVLFARADISQRVAKSALVSKPLVNFRKAIELLREHAQREYHKVAVLSLEAFRSVFSQAQPSIVRQIDVASQKLIDGNRRKLQSIVETVLLCGRQNISLRGRCDSSIDVQNREAVFSPNPMRPVFFLTGEKVGQGGYTHRKYPHGFACKARAVQKVFKDSRVWKQNHPGQAPGT